MVKCVIGLPLSRHRKRWTILPLTLSNFLCDCDLAFDTFLHSMCTLCLDNDSINTHLFSNKKQADACHVPAFI